MKKRLCFIVISVSVILVGAFLWYINIPENKANRILKSMMQDYEKTVSIFYTGFAALGEDSITIGESEYYLIEGEYKTLNDLEELLTKVYTRDMANRILSQSTGGDEPIIIEQEGRLYRKDAYDAGFPFEIPVKSAIKMSNDEWKIEAVSAINEDFIVCITLEKENEQWKIKEITEQERQ